MPAELENEVMRRIHRAAASAVVLICDGGGRVVCRVTKWHRGVGFSSLSHDPRVCSCDDAKKLIGEARDLHGPLHIAF